VDELEQDLEIALPLLALMLSGISGYMIGDTLYIYALTSVGLQRTFPVTMALFILLSVAGGVVLLDEPFSWGLVMGGLLIGAGIYLVVLQRAADQPAPGSTGTAMTRNTSLRTALWLLPLVGITWAVATLLLASSKEDLGAIAAGTIRIPAGAFALIAVTAALQPKALIAPFRKRSHIGMIALTGVLGTGIGSLLYVYSVLEAGAARAVILNATSPLMAVPLSIIFLGERLTRPVAYGTVLCVAGVLLVVA
jgi:drug/metabolite transporter (DMT)-like permease